MSTEASTNVKAKQPRLRRDKTGQKKKKVKRT